MENTKNTIRVNYLKLKSLLSIDPFREITIVRPDSATLFKSMELPSSILKKTLRQSRNPFTYSQIQKIYKTLDFR